MKTAKQLNRENSENLNKRINQMDSEKLAKITECPECGSKDIEIHQCCMDLEGRLHEYEIDCMDCECSFLFDALRSESRVLSSGL